jgi:hypothetical protein
VFIGEVGYAAAAPTLARTIELLRAGDRVSEEGTRWLGTAGHLPGLLALDVWDDGSARELPRQQVRRARAAGALVQLQLALGVLASSHLLAGELLTAQALFDEDGAIAEATGHPTLRHPGQVLGRLARSR